MVADRLLGNPQAIGDVPVGEPLSNRGQDFGVTGEIRKHARRDVTWAFLLNGSPAAVNTLPPIQELVGALNVAALA